MDFNKMMEAFDEMIKDLEKKKTSVKRSTKRAKKAKAELIGLTAEMIREYTANLTVDELGDVCASMVSLWDKIPETAAILGIEDCVDGIQRAAAMSLKKVEEND